jgi:hypothetical protein
VVHCRRKLQCYTHWLGIQTYLAQRTRSTQNNGKNQLKTSILGRTHILAIWQE